VPAYGLARASRLAFWDLAEIDHDRLMRRIMAAAAVIAKSLPASDSCDGCGQLRDLGDLASANSSYCLHLVHLSGEPTVSGPYCRAVVNNPSRSRRDVEQGPRYLNLYLVILNSILSDTELPSKMTSIL
jgi:hypothetical protein